MITENPMLCDSQYVLEDFFDEGVRIGPALSTKAIVNEIKRGGDPGKEVLLREEDKMNYQEVGERFRVIESNTVLVIADEDLKHRLRQGQSDWRDIQRKGIPMRWDRVQRLDLPKLIEGVYEWKLQYDSFLGTMAGVLAEMRS